MARPNNCREQNWYAPYGEVVQALPPVGKVMLLLLREAVLGVSVPEFTPTGIESLAGILGLEAETVRKALAKLAADGLFVIDIPAPPGVFDPRRSR